MNCAVRIVEVVGMVGAHSDVSVGAVSFFVGTFFAKVNIQTKNPGFLRFFVQVFLGFSTPDLNKCSVYLTQSLRLGPSLILPLSQSEHTLFLLLLLLFTILHNQKKKIKN